MQGLSIAPAAPAAVSVGLAAGVALSGGGTGDVAEGAGGSAFGAILASQIKGKAPAAGSGVDAVLPEKTNVGKGKADVLATESAVVSNPLSDFLALANAGAIPIQITPVVLATIVQAGDAVTQRGGDQPVLAVEGDVAVAKLTDLSDVAAKANPFASLLADKVAEGAGSAAMEEFAGSGKMLPASEPADLVDVAAAPLASRAMSAKPVAGAATDSGTLPAVELAGLTGVAAKTALLTSPAMSADKPLAETLAVSGKILPAAEPAGWSGVAVTPLASQLMEKTTEAADNFAAEKPADGSKTLPVAELADLPDAAVKSAPFASQSMGEIAEAVGSSNARKSADAGKTLPAAEPAGLSAVAAKSTPFASQPIGKTVEVAGSSSAGELVDAGKTLPAVEPAGLADVAVTPLVSQAMGKTAEAADSPVARKSVDAGKTLPAAKPADLADVAAAPLASQAMDKTTEVVGRATVEKPVDSGKTLPAVEAADASGAAAKAARFASQLMGKAAEAAGRPLARKSADSGKNLPAVELASSTGVAAKAALFTSQPVYKATEAADGRVAGESAGSSEPADLVANPVANPVAGIVAKTAPFVGQSMGGFAEVADRELVGELVGSGKTLAVAERADLAGVDAKLASLASRQMDKAAEAADMSAAKGVAVGGKIPPVVDPAINKPLVEEFMPSPYRETQREAASAGASDFPALSAMPLSAAMAGYQAVAAQAPAMEIAAPVGTPGWGNALADKVVWMNNQGNQVAELHLNPPHLGPLEVQLTFTNDQASAVFVSHHPAVREAIEAAMPRLREILADSGIMLGNTMVGAESFQQQQQAFAKNSNGGSGANRGESAAPDIVGIGAPVQEARVNRGLVDTFV